MKRLLLVLAVALIGCTSPEESGIKVIVGAKLIPAPGQPPVDYSVIVIEDGKFKAVGPQSSTPVPKGAEMIQGLGATVEPVPGGGPIEPGKPADLVFKGTTERVMHGGQWAQ
jgi:hypothetical protein